MDMTQTKNPQEEDQHIEEALATEEHPTEAEEEDPMTMTKTVEDTSGRHLSHLHLL